MSEVRVYDAPSDLVGRWVRETAMQALRAENARLKEALQGMVKLVDDGLLVRSIANDHIAGWGIRALPIMQALQQANEALQPKEPSHD